MSICSVWCTNVFRHERNEISIKFDTSKVKLQILVKKSSWKFWSLNFSHSTEFVIIIVSKYMILRHFRCLSMWKFHKVFIIICTICRQNRISPAKRTIHSQTSNRQMLVMKIYIYLATSEMLCINVSHWHGFANEMAKNAGIIFLGRWCYPKTYS